MSGINLIELYEQAHLGAKVCSKAVGPKYWDKMEMNLIEEPSGLRETKTYL